MVSEDRDPGREVLLPAIGEAGNLQPGVLHRRSDPRAAVTPLDDDIGLQREDAFDVGSEVLTCDVMRDLQRVGEHLTMRPSRIATHEV